MSSFSSLECVGDGRQDLPDNYHFVLLDQVREQGPNVVLDDILGVEAKLRWIASVSLLEMSLPHFVGQKADHSKFAAVNVAFQRFIM
jgi:hypothetical protein